MSSNEARRVLRSSIAAARGLVRHWFGMGARAAPRTWRQPILPGPLDGAGQAATLPPEGAVAWPLNYRARPERLCPSIAVNGSRADAVTSARFHVTEADPALLAFLGDPAQGFHVIELRCAGLEFLWRSDLTRVLDTRHAVLGRMTIFSGAGDLELAHLARPLIANGRVVAITGCFDLIGATTGEAVQAVDWSTVRSVRRFERARVTHLPAAE